MPDLNLPPEMERLRNWLPAVVALLEERASYGAALLSARQGLQIMVDNQEERVTQTQPTSGSVVTLFDGQALREQAVGSFDAQVVEQAARRLAAETQIHPGHAIDPGPQRRGDFVTPAQIPVSSLSTAEKLDRIRQLHQRLRSMDERIATAQVFYQESSEISVFANRNADLAQRIERVNLTIVPVTTGEDGMRYDLLPHAGSGGWELLDFSDDELQGVVQGSLALHRAERIEPGEYTIITAPSVTGVLAHESFGHGVETDMFLKERAKAAQYIDRRVGSPLVNIYDDPSYPGLFGSYFFDDEGWLAAPTAIVEAGIFKRGLTDLYSAAALGIARSANGRRQDFSRKAYARMSNTFVGSGDTPVADLFAQVERGVYLEKMSSGMEDPQGWGIQITCLYGHEIVDGQMTGRIFAPVGISGYVPDVLASVRAVGSDFQAFPGYCGKGHKETVLASIGGPHLLLKARLG